MGLNSISRLSFAKVIDRKFKIELQPQPKPEPTTNQLKRHWAQTSLDKIYCRKHTEKTQLQQEHTCKHKECKHQLNEARYS